MRATALTSSGKSIAYFSAEFALHQSLPIYAGGLGVLAGDHCKEASDLGVPLIGVGFMYPQGYFHQNLTPDGWQQEVYEQLNWADAPIEPAITPEGKPCIVAVPLGNRTVLVQVWRVRVGRVKLYLLDTNVEENAPWDRDLSARLYGGDRETRVQQEIILGIGGVRVLKQMGSEPAVYHLNEGHAAFVVLQRIRELCEKGWAFDAALDEVRRTTVFTTHTPVPAGHDAFPFHLVETHLAGAWGDLGGYRERFLALGHYDNGSGPMFNMTALVTAHERRRQRRQQAARRRHERTCGSRSGPTRRASSLPIHFITNGVHVPTWMSSEMGTLFERHLGPDWLDRHDDPAVADRVLAIPDEELWAARQSLRSFLFGFIRERARTRWTKAEVNALQVVAAGTMLDQNTLTIGFARRFTGYKRPELIFTDAERLARILTAPGRPVQLVFAGKAHPADEVGKHHLQRIYKRALDPMFGGRVAFVEGLRPACGALPRAGLRRLDEQPAQAARSERHQRDEGGDQRHAAPLDRRRLVGRRVHRRERMAHRGRRPIRTTTGRRTGPTCSRCTRSSRTSWSRRSTTATPTAFRGAGCRWSSSRSGRCCRSSARAEW